MKPISIKMQAFGPYLDETFVDFRPLYSARIFLISGPTGGGKTTILDAMSFALYGKATGSARAFRDMRCISAEDSEDTVAEFCFLLGDETYKFRRTLHIRTKRNGEHECEIDAECHIEKADGWHLIESGAEKVVKKAEELLGFNHDQFSQVIVLPQGEFRRLLLAKSKEKAEILEVLFATVIWKKIGENIGQRLKGIKEKLALLSSGTELLLESVNAESAEQLSAMAESAAQLSEQTRNLVDSAKKAFDAAAVRFNEAKTLCAEFDAKAECEKKIAGLKTMSAEIDEMEKRLKSAEKAKTVVPYYNAVESANNAERRRKNENAAALERAAKALEALETLKQSLQAVPVAQEKEQKMRARAAEIAMIMPDAKRLNALKTEITENAALSDRLSEQIKASEESRTALEKRISDGEKWMVDALKNYKNIEREELINNFAARAAAELADGQPCPVCGAIHHPKPAVPSAVKPEKTAEQAKTEYLRCEKALEKLKQNRADAEKQLETLKKQFDEADRACAAAKATYDNVFARVGGDCNYAELEKQQKQLVAAAEQLKTKIEAVRKKEQDAVAENMAATQLKEQNSVMLNEAVAAAKAAENEFARAANAAGFPPETDFAKLVIDADEEQRIKTTVEKHKTDLNVAENQREQLLKKLDGLTKPDLNTLEKSRADAEKDFSEKTARLGELLQKQKALEDIKTRIAEMHASSAALENEYSSVCRVYELITGKNMMKTPLHNFVLGLMLDDVVLAASRYLGSLSRGRYALVRADYSGGSGLRGLDIEVTDAHSGGQRKACTLSGGELFLASLSLAFGLAEVVQSFSGGVKLDSIFIDEGFGTLDSETLEAAMKALSDIRSEGRLVGIISHVNELKSRIPARIEVTSGDDGSCISVKGV